LTADGEVGMRVRPGLTGLTRHFFVANTGFVADSGGAAPGPLGVVNSRL
jgi:hypothetical protein